MPVAGAVDAADRRFPVKPMLPGFYRVIPMGSDVLQLRSAGRVLRVAGPGVGDFGPRLLSALDGRDSLTAVVQRLALDAGPAADLVGHLHSEGIVSDAADAADDGSVRGAVGGPAAAGEVYGELGRNAATVQAALGAARVALVGLGPVGRLTARHLAAAGVGELVLADAAPVTAADQSALAAHVGDVGSSRAEVTSNECTAAGGDDDGGTRVRISSEPFTIDADAVDLVVVEVDEVLERAGALNRRGVTSGVAVLFHSEGTLQAVVGPLVTPGAPGCHQCLLDRERSHIRHFEERVAYERWLASGGGGRPPALLSGFASLVAGLVSVEVLRQIGGFQEPVTRTGVLVADLRTSQVRTENLLPVPGCPVCGAR